MPICIECRYPVPQLYHVLHGSSLNQQKSSNTSTAANPSISSKSTSSQHNEGKHLETEESRKTKESQPRTRGEESTFRGGGEAKPGGVAGGDVRLTQCPRCKRFADKYVEHDFVVLFIDLVLVKPQVRLFSPTFRNGELGGEL